VQISTVQRRRRRRECRRSSSIDQRPDLNLVAQEIETVIYGGNHHDESDGDGDEDDNIVGDDDSDDDGRDRWGAMNDRINSDSFGEYPRTARRSDGACRRSLLQSFVSPRLVAAPRRRNSQPTNQARTWGEEERAEDINSYTLFDMPFDGGGPRTFPTMSTVHHQPRPQSSRSMKGPSIIYAQKYRSAGSLLLPIMVFLAATFVSLLVIRILMGLLTAAIGIMVLCLFIVHVLCEFWTRPIRFVKTVHSSPVLFWGSMGAILGLLDALWRHQLLPFLIDTQTCMTPRMVSDVISSSWTEWITLATVWYSGAGSSPAPIGSHGSSHVDLLLLSGLIWGLIYGVEIGVLWLVLLGDASKPSILTAYLYRRIWRPLRRQYRRIAIVRRQQSARVLVAVSNPTNGGNSSGAHEKDDDNAAADPRAGGEDTRRCVICLECFGDHGRGWPQQHPAGQQEAISAMMATTAPKLVGATMRSGSDRYQLMPCLHSFHRDCARNWLSVRQSCPICRVAVEGMQGCTVGSKVEWAEA
jgi:hypothetical protein